MTVFDYRGRRYRFAQSPKTGLVTEWTWLDPPIPDDALPKGFTMTDTAYEAKVRASLEQAARKKGLIK